MRLGALLLGCLLVTTAFAGCMGGGSGEDVESSSTDDPQFGQDAVNETNTTNTTPEDPGPVLNTTVHTGAIEGFSTPDGTHYCTPTGPCENDVDFQVRDNTTAVLVEVEWNASAGMYVDLNVPFEYCETGPAGFLLLECPDPGEAEGDSPLSIEVTDPQMLENTGEWMTDLWVDSTTPTTVEYTLHLTLVSEGELPRGYSNVQG